MALESIGRILRPLEGTLARLLCCQPAPSQGGSLLPNRRPRGRAVESAALVLDACTVLALLVAAHIAREAWHLVREALDGLTDSALPAAACSTARKAGS